MPPQSPSAHVPNRIFLKPIYRRHSEISEPQECIENIFKREIKNISSDIQTSEGLALTDDPVKKYCRIYSSKGTNEHRRKEWDVRSTCKQRIQ